MSAHAITNPKHADYVRVPRPLWRTIKRYLPPLPKRHSRGRPPADTRAVINGIWYILLTGCQWKDVHRSWFGVASSVLHERFQTWQCTGRFAGIMQALLHFYDCKRRILWQWQAIDSRLCAAPLGGEATGKNLIDHVRRGAKLHILVDGRGTPLAVEVTGANRNDKCAVVAVVPAGAVRRPTVRQHFCADRANDDGHALIREAS